MKNKISKQLLELADYDLSIRDKLLKENKLAEGYHPEMESVHRNNAQKLREIIQEIGFPTISKVGKEANDAAWLIIQHSIAEPEFMKNAYQLMLENSKDTELKNLAYLFDRIQFFQGKPQKFGTQLNSDGTIYPVIDKNKINELRSKNNLPVLSNEEIDHIPPIEDIERIENENPGYILWRKKVGWV
ncbi:hypothetical protein QFZ37_003413 [Chryseobacterium ginsenosidimutans]|uniref:DUF6624 domain-containing protein n=1 Tax=Chryseobacterium ginsenosidimutans TaxID=687846 RepID=UPI0027866AAD|nr:DUF6624 domain-containing protein [Chryseobacterium ginsenosidimutans]MDQ0595044.1 hypothetical protein [Chryseobacterium ginsenosidimutans]